MLCFNKLTYEYNTKITLKNFSFCGSISLRVLYDSCKTKIGNIGIIGVLGSVQTGP